MRELRVEDALMYLDQVKIEFRDRPQIYNEFLHIMKTFKSQEIDTPGVILRVTRLFQGNKGLVLGFNTFLPDGYKIEIPDNGTGTVYYKTPYHPQLTPIHSLMPAPASGPVSASAASAAVNRGSDNQFDQRTSNAPPQQGPPQQSSQSQASLQGTSQQAPHGMALNPRPALTYAELLKKQENEAAFGMRPMYAQHSSAPATTTTTVSGAAAVGHGHAPSVQATMSQQAKQSQPQQQQQQQQQHPQSQPQLQLQHPKQQQQQHLHGTEIRHGIMMQNGSSQGAQSQVGMQRLVPSQPDHMQMQQQQQQQTMEMSAMHQQQRQRTMQQLQGNADVGVMQQQQQQQQQRMMHHPPQQLQQQQPPQPTVEEPSPGPVEFDHAINYVTTIKKTFANDPDTYRKFLEILHTYQKEQRGIKCVLDEVSVLFADHPVLLRDFTYFLPDAVQQQAKMQLAQAVRQAESRRAALNSKQAIENQARQQRPIPPPPVVQPQPPQPEQQSLQTVWDANQPRKPFGVKEGRSEKVEREICNAAVYGVVSFDPVRPPRKSELTPAQAAAKYGRPRTIPEIFVQPSTKEATFFERAKEHLMRKELASEKSSGSRRHTPYTEFLKCLHLYGGGILNKEELLLLLRSIFMQGHAPKSGLNASGGSNNPKVASAANKLLKDFEKLLVARGPYARQQSFLKDKSKYGAITCKEWDSSLCDDVTPSYKTYPSDYPYEDFFTHSGQTAQDASVLNTSVICVRNEKKVSASKTRIYDSLEEYDGIRARKNIYEEALAKVEDERFEFDFAIETNASAMRQVQPLSEEVSMLKENEEKDGQPIGRLQYQLRPRSLLSTHIGAIARLYGEQGDEVIHHLMRNPISVLPIVFKRLKEKDSEWRKVRAGFMMQWRSICDLSYDASLDSTSYFKKKDIEKSFSHDALLEECKRAFHFVKKPKEMNKATESIAATFAASHADSSMLLFHSHVSVKATQDMPYKDVYDCLALQIQGLTFKTSTEKEKVSRIWAEFMIPWFELPTYWFWDELRDKARSEKSSIIVKYSPGQNVKTAFGEGRIVRYNEGQNSIAPHYEVQLPFATAYIRPSSIVHHICTDIDYVRQDGFMEILSDYDNSGDASSKELPTSCQLIYGTEKIYFFMRLFCVLLGLFDSIKKNLTDNDEARDGDVESYGRNRYQNFLSIVKEYVNEDITLKGYEMRCRRLTKFKCYELYSIPRLLEKCTDNLLKVAREDKLLTLYDFCNLNKRDPVVQRSRSFSVAEDASFRIQYLWDEGKIHFSYLPIEKEMLMAPRSLNGMNSSITEKPSSSTISPCGDNDGTIASTMGNNSGNVSVDNSIKRGSNTDSDDEPSNKRTKLC